MYFIIIYKFFDDKHNYIQNYIVYVFLRNEAVSGVYWKILLFLINFEFKQTSEM